MNIVGYRPVALQWLVYVHVYVRISMWVYVSHVRTYVA